MFRLGRLILGVSLFALASGPATAQQPVSLTIRDGMVTLKAENAPLRAILGEWARIGNTNVIGADRVAGAPVTIELTDVSEHQALEVLLRNVSGYMLATRPAGAQGVSAYNRILIMPPSTAPRALPPTPVAAAPRLLVPDDDSPQEVEGPGTVRQGVRLPVINGQNGPGNTQAPAPLPVPETTQPVSPGTPGSVIVTPNNPFGLPPGSSAQPGVIVPVPQQPQRPNPTDNQ